MPKSKEVENYPLHYMNLFLSAVETGEHIISCKDVKQAKRIQFDLYGYRTAVAA